MYYILDRTVLRTVLAKTPLLHAWSLLTELSAVKSCVPWNTGVQLQHGMKVFNCSSACKSTAPPQEPARGGVAWLCGIPSCRSPKRLLSGSGKEEMTHLKPEVKTSTSPNCSTACSSERPTDARGGLLKTALAMALYSALASASPLHRQWAHSRHTHTLLLPACGTRTEW